MSENFTPQEMLAYTVEMASAYFTGNDVPVHAIQEVLKEIFLSIANIAKDANNIKHRPALTPAVPVEESVHEDYIICLEDGKKLQMLKRHLSTVYGMSVEQYKERWGLAQDYQVVSPSYAKRRSSIAKTTGLGSTGRKKLKVA
jgi:predicted transcriptional regulator